MMRGDINRVKKIIVFLSRPGPGLMQLWRLLLHTYVIHRCVAQLPGAPLFPVHGAHFVERFQCVQRGPDACAERLEDAVR